jgi:hypothetical protein
MSGDFRTALALALARDLSLGVPTSNTSHEIMSVRADRALAKARSTDGLGSFPEQRPRGSWANSRSGWRQDGDNNA